MTFDLVRGYCAIGAVGRKRLRAVSETLLLRRRTLDPDIKRTQLGIHVPLQIQDDVDGPPIIHRCLPPPNSALVLYHPGNIQIPLGLDPGGCVVPIETGSTRQGVPIWWDTFFEWLKRRKIRVWGAAVTGASGIIRRRAIPMAAIPAGLTSEQAGAAWSRRERRRKCSLRRVSGRWRRQRLSQRQTGQRHDGC
jgi:hypothetical protein